MFTRAGVLMGPLEIVGFKKDEFVVIPLIFREYLLNKAILLSSFGFEQAASQLLRMVPGLQVSKVPGLKPVKEYKRFVVGNFLRLHWELHLQFSDVQTIWTIKTQPKCSISGVYCLNLVKNMLWHLWRSHWAEHQGEDKGITS